MYMFIGREEQLEQLKALWRKPVASIDLLIQTRRMVYVVEIKRRESVVM